MISISSLNQVIFYVALFDNTGLVTKPELKVHKDII